MLSCVCSRAGAIPKKGELYPYCPTNLTSNTLEPTIHASISQQYTIHLLAKDFHSMIEDPNLTRKILEHFAQDDVGFPANITLEGLCNVFGDIEPDKVAYHLLCAAENHLLLVDYNKTDTLGGKSHFTFGPISGLTPEESEYVHYSRTTLWDTAMHKVKESGVAVTTAILVDFLPKLAMQVLGVDDT